MPKKKLYWHFLPDDGRLQYSPRRKVVVGKTMKIKDNPILCKHGFHASKRAIDALRYAPGALVCLVELGGEMIESDDKVVAQERTVVAMADAAKTLHLFACWCAERSLKEVRAAGREPDKRSWEAVRVKRRWIAARATDAELDAARSSAESAAWSAAWSSARSATYLDQNKKLESMLRKLLREKGAKG